MAASLVTPNNANLRGELWRVVRDYGGAVSLAVAALLLRSILGSLLGEGRPLATLYVAVAAAVFFFGWRPALMASAVAYAGALRLFVDRSDPVVTDPSSAIVSFGIFFSSCGLIIWLGESARRSRSRAQESAAHALERQLLLEQEVARRTEIEGRLRERAEELELLMKMQPVGVWIAHDPACRVVTGNPYASRMFSISTGVNSAAGRPEDERGWKRFLADGVELRDEDLPLQKVLRTAAPVENAELDVELTSGRTISVLASAAPLFNNDGSVRGAVTAFVDISERKRTEAALRDADRRKDEFLALLAHELRNPLAPIRNAIEFLQLKGPAEPELVQARGIIQRQLAQMTRLVDDLLDVSRITRGKINLQRELVDLNAVIAAALEPGRPLFHAKEQLLSVDLPDGKVWMLADATRLEQAFTNLLNNASKFTPRGGRVSLEVRLSGNDAILVFSDTGVGIPADQLPQIFEMFTQLDRSLDRSNGGLGIGLSLAQRLINLHGGTIEAKSDGPHQGTQFIVRLPVHAAPEIVPVPGADVLLSARTLHTHPSAGSVAGR